MKMKARFVIFLLVIGFNHGLCGRRSPHQMAATNDLHSYPFSREKLQQTMVLILLQAGEKEAYKTACSEFKPTWQPPISARVEMYTNGWYGPKMRSTGIAFACGHFTLHVDMHYFGDRVADVEFNRFPKIWISAVFIAFVSNALRIFRLKRKHWPTLIRIPKAQDESEISHSKSFVGQDQYEYCCSSSERLAIKPEMIISTSRLKIDAEVLGRGEFGIVWKGMLDNNSVAVKTCKYDTNVWCFNAFLEEIKMMASVGDHPNIVKFLGAVVDNISERDWCAVIELSPLGSLNNYLLKHAASYDSCELGATRLGKDACTQRYSACMQDLADVVLNHSTLVSFCSQIAVGMEFLSLKGVIHADLATRNVLVFPNNVVKVADFGLSRKLYDRTSYTETRMTPLPWRWMALESLRHFQFSTKSDVWSFGVTVWEIFCLAQVPYSGMAWTPTFTDQLEAGLRLSKPQHAGHYVFSWMMKCWENNPDNRPSFAECKTFFRSVGTRLHKPDSNSLSD